MLEIMERHDDLSIRDKIYNQLLLGEPTKFNHDRWGVVMGIRSGVVGTEYGSFTEAVKKGRKGKGWQWFFYQKVKSKKGNKFIKNDYIYWH